MAFNGPDHWFDNIVLFVVLVRARCVNGVEFSLLMPNNNDDNNNANALGNDTLGSNPSPSDMLCSLKDRALSLTSERAIDTVRYRISMPRAHVNDKLN